LRAGEKAESKKKEIERKKEINFNLEVILDYAFVAIYSMYPHVV